MSLCLLIVKFIFIYWTDLCLSPIKLLLLDICEAILLILAWSSVSIYLYLSIWMEKNEITEIRLRCFVAVVTTDLQYYGGVFKIFRLWAVASSQPSTMWLAMFTYALRIKADWDRGWDESSKRGSYTGRQTPCSTNWSEVVQLTDY